MIRELILGAALATFGLVPASAQSVQTLFDGRLEVKIPQGYEAFDPSSVDPNDYAPGESPYEGELLFVRRGGRAALARAFPHIDPDKGAFNGFFRNDIRAIVIIRVAKLIEKNPAESREPDNGLRLVVPTGSSAEDIHNLFCNAFARFWGGGEFTFDLFDVDAGIGRCVNHAGAFVAVFTRKVGNSLVMIEAMNPVFVLLRESKFESSIPSLEAFSAMSDSEKWELYKSATNSKAAEQILLSARELP